MEHGWNERAGAVTQAFGSEDLGANAAFLADLTRPVPMRQE